MITIETKKCLICSHIEICHCPESVRYWVKYTMDEVSFNEVKNIKYNPDGERSEIQTPLALFLEQRKEKWNNRSKLV